MNMVGAANPMDKKRIGRMLIDEGLIEPEHLRTALKVQSERGGKIVETLIHLGYVDLTTIASFLASRPGVASIDLDNYRVPRELCELIPREYAQQNEVFPIDKMGPCLTVAMSFPIDINTIRQLEEMTGLRVTALLCHAQDIRKAIRQYYPSDKPATGTPSVNDMAEQIETGLRIENVVQMLRNIDALPTMPETVQRVQEATNDPDTSLRDIADIVATDPPVAAKLLQLANSAAYGFLSKINNVHSAITLLGMRETYMAVLSSAIIQITESSKNFDHEAYWRSSMFCATAARNIATACGQGRKAGAFTAGLLCDIGRFALSEVAAARYAKIDTEYMGSMLVACEEEALAIGHPEAGHILAVHWQLPPEIIDAIRFHHRPELAKSNQEVVAIVALAAIMTDAHMRDAKPEEALFEPHMDLLQRIGIDTATATDAYGAARMPEMTSSLS